MEGKRPLDHTVLFIISHITLSYQKEKKYSKTMCKKHAREQENKKKLDMMCQFFMHQIFLELH